MNASDRDVFVLLIVLAMATAVVSAPIICVYRRARQSRSRWRWLALAFVYPFALTGAAALAMHFGQRDGQVVGWTCLLVFLVAAIDEHRTRSRQHFWRRDS